MKVGKMVSFSIDGKKIKAEEGTMLLDIARQHGVEIPTFCTHEAVSRTGSCRLCVVEVRQGTRSKIVASCMYPVSEGIVVDTKTERVLNVRRLVLQLLMARCPESDILKEMANEMGIEPEPRFKPDTDKGNCILCRLCVRVCEETVGVSAIGSSYRGPGKSVGPPFMENSKACIACGACAYVCPTQHIVMESTDDSKRKIWGRTFKMQACDKCGRYFAPVDQLKFISNTAGVPLSELHTCPSCR
ncbi:MAG: 2Fe-2S iron-sulfur cluster-binding protein [Syntrophales bacterium]